MICKNEQRDRHRHMFVTNTGSNRRSAWSVCPCNGFCLYHPCDIGEAIKTTGLESHETRLAPQNYARETMVSLSMSVSFCLMSQYHGLVLHGHVNVKGPCFPHEQHTFECGSTNAESPRTPKPNFNRNQKPRFPTCASWRPRQ